MICDAIYFLFCPKFVSYPCPSSVFYFAWGSLLEERYVSLRQTGRVPSPPVSFSRRLSGCWCHYSCYHLVIPVPCSVRFASKSLFFPSFFFSLFVFLHNMLFISYVCGFCGYVCIRSSSVTVNVLGGLLCCWLLRYLSALFLSISWYFVNVRFVCVQWATFLFPSLAFLSVLSFRPWSIY